MEGCIFIGSYDNKKDPSMLLATIVNQFKKFREQIFNCFSNRADATMELLDATSGNLNARSVVELSLNSAFRRKYGSIRDAIENFHKDEKQQTRIEHCLLEHCDPISESRPYCLLVLDCTPAPREYSPTLGDKGYVYKPTVVPGNTPITVGHQYSIMGFLPEKIEKQNFPWVLPVSARRVPTSRKGPDIGLEQLDMAAAAFKGELMVMVVDSGYGSPEFIEGASQQPDVITIIRLNSNRILYHPATPKNKKITGRRERGHVLWYGEPFNFKDESTWRTPNATISYPYNTRKGKQWTVEIQSWDDILMRQKRGIALNEYPFTLLRVRILDENNLPVYKRAMWLMVCGKRRKELTLKQSWCAYNQRYDIEHFFKFGKTRLLLDKFQSPETVHEESWWQISTLAYAQLYMARKLANNFPKPWEKNLPEMQPHEGIKAPRQVQIDFSRLTAEIGTPAAAPKQRGKPLGRTKGFKLIRRQHHPVISKRKKRLNQVEKPPDQAIA